MYTHRINLQQRKGSNRNIDTRYKDFRRKQNGLKLILKIRIRVIRYLSCRQCSCQVQNNLKAITASNFCCMPHKGSYVNSCCSWGYTVTHAFNAATYKERPVQCHNVRTYLMWTFPRTYRPDITYENITYYI